MIISNATSEARRAGKITAGGATPGSEASDYTSAEGAAERVEWLCHPVGVGVSLRPVSRGFTPACGLNSPLGFLPMVLTGFRASVVASCKAKPQRGLIGIASHFNGW